MRASKPSIRANQFKTIKSLLWGYSDMSFRFAKGRRLHRMSAHYMRKSSKFAY